MSYDSVDQLRIVIEEILADKFGTFQLDDDGDYYVDRGRVRVYITPIDWGDGDTLLKIWTVAAHDVDNSKKLMAYLNDLNRRSVFGVFYYQQGMVYLSQTLIGNALDPEELLWTLKGIAKMTKQMDKLMARGFGGASYDWTHDYGEDWYHKPLTAAEYEAGYAVGALLLVASLDSDARDAWAWAFDDEDEFDDFFDMLSEEVDIAEEALHEWETEWEVGALDDGQDDDFDDDGDLGGDDDFDFDFDDDNDFDDDDDFDDFDDDDDDGDDFDDDDDDDDGDDFDDFDDDDDDDGDDDDGDDDDGDDDFDDGDDRDDGDDLDDEDDDRGDFDDGDDRDDGDDKDY